MSDDGRLAQTLTLKDLMLFGTSSILGSGGFNLIGKAVRAGGGHWPALLGGVAALFGGASWAYSRALAVEGTNTAETDIIGRMFGSAAAGAAGAGILTFNIFSIAVVLVFVSQLIYPGASWTAQAGLSTIFLAIMTWFSLAGIDINKEVINWTTWALVVVLFAAMGLGGWGAISQGLTLGAAPTATAAGRSIMYFFFILAGFDALMKFTREAVDAQRDLPIAFFGANALSALAVLGVAAALSIWVPGLTEQQECNAVGHLFARFGGPNMVGSIRVAMILFMLVTTFVVFLSTTRYLYGVGESQKEMFHWLTETNEVKAPWKAVAVVAVIGFLGLLLNNTDVLVKISNVGLIVILGLVAAAVCAHDWIAGAPLSAAISGLTVGGLGGVLRAVFL